MECVDEYMHADQNCVYITTSIATLETDNLFEEGFAEYCSCMLCDNNCMCRNRFGPCNTRSLHTECTTQCTCPCECGNRITQRGPIKDLTIIDTDKGYGLSCTSLIPAESFICEYAGEIISLTERDRRFRRQMETGATNYMVNLREHFGGSVLTTVVDPARFGNIGRYINHSCQPNCELLPVRREYLTPILCVFAKCDIHAKCELTFDYGDGRQGFDDSKQPQRKVPCLCASQSCRGFLPFTALETD